jgi:hypothetical protein
MSGRALSNIADIGKEIVSLNTSIIQYLRELIC